MSEKDITDGLKRSRRNAKGQLTRQVNALRQLLTEEADVTDCKERLKVIKQSFARVEEKHSALVDTIEDESNYQTEEEWMEECQHAFLIEVQELERRLTDLCKTVDSVKLSPRNELNSDQDNVVSLEVNVNDQSGTDDVTRNNVVESVSDRSSNDSVSNERQGGTNELQSILQALVLPRPELTTFNGDPLRYYPFITSFDALMRDAFDDRIRLTNLIKYCRGKAFYALQCCMVKEPSEGYALARRILKERFGDKGTIVQSWIKKITDTPRVDHEGIREFSDNLRNCYETLEAMGYSKELDNQRGLRMIIEKLPKYLQTRWIRENQRLKSTKGTDPSLKDVIVFVNSAAVEVSDPVFGDLAKPKPSREKQNAARGSSSYLINQSQKNPKKMFCPYCNSTSHFLGSCDSFKELDTADIKNWVKNNNRCARCGRKHQEQGCTLKKPCRKCPELHLSILHDSLKPDPTTPSVQQLYLDKQQRPHDVLLKVVPVTLYSPTAQLDTYAILDDGSMRTIVLSAAVEKLGATGRRDSIFLTTVNEGRTECVGRNISLQVSAKGMGNNRFNLDDAFTSTQLNLSDYDYPVKELQEKYQHLRGIQFPEIKGATPLILIGSDNVQLITPQEPVRVGQRNAPAAVRTTLGWTLQGPSSCLSLTAQEASILFTSDTQLRKDVRRLWEIDVLPTTKQATRSRQDNQAIALLENGTTREPVENVQRYVTPLLRCADGTQFTAGMEAVLPALKRLERRYRSKPEAADTHNKLVKKLVEDRSVEKISEEEATQTTESWYIPHHVVSHNDKNRLVFNCSYEYQGKNLNAHLLPGPTLGSSLLGVILRFRQHPVAISGDIQAMFHQVRLKPEDRPLLRFIWRDCDESSRPTIYQWLVLVFGTTCSPCCASFAVQKHVADAGPEFSDVLRAVQEAFYVDNCLDSLPTTEEAKKLVKRMRTLLMEGGFNIRHWASNVPEVLQDMPLEAISPSYERTINADANVPEPMLGMKWNCQTDALHYSQNLKSYEVLNMRTIYRILASQYDPIGYLTPFLAKAKILVQDLWRKEEVNWDAEVTEPDLKERWNKWEAELADLPEVKLPRCYMPTLCTSYQLHVFCDASERVYGAVAYLRGEDNLQATVSFVMARSRVAPKRQLSMPRLELSAALVGAQLTEVLRDELTIQMAAIHLWSDSTTVLRWLQSESCRYKVFVGTRVTEILHLTKGCEWHYVNTRDNPADDITRGKQLIELAGDSRWRNGPPFLNGPTEEWPEMPPVLPTSTDDSSELKRSTFCGLNLVDEQRDAELENFDDYDKLLHYLTEMQNGAAPSEVERAAWKIVQRDCFPEEIAALRAGKQVPATSRLNQLNPVLDETSDLICVGGRLRHAELPLEQKQPVILDPSHNITRLLIKKFDERLNHPGAERVFAELRRQVWILKGREVVRGIQRKCPTCRRWRATPDVPKMNDLPPARLRLFRPVFHSTGVDCFGPMLVKVGRRTEKRWGIVYKCLTVGAIHLELLDSMNTDAFLLSFRRFVARRGKPAELLSDCGTNFKGGDAELATAFQHMTADLRQKLRPFQVKFNFNPPLAPHFGGAWEREVRSVKSALRVAIGEQQVTEPVLHTLLVEVEGILNSKPLGYVSSDSRDVDPVTPNILLMGRYDPAVPQVIYSQNDLLTRKRWRHSQLLADHFWRHFINYYLPSLQIRQKWWKESNNLAVDDVVMIVDKQLPRGQWPVGKVVAVVPGMDDRVRIAEVDVSGKKYVRPVVKLIKLPKLE